MRECSVPSCFTLVRYPHRFCAAHWRQLPTDLQQAMVEAQAALNFAKIGFDDFAQIEAEAVAGIRLTAGTDAGAGSIHAARRHRRAAGGC